MLLRAVVQVALEPAALLILGRDEALPRCPEVVEPGKEFLVQADVLEYQAGLSGEIRDQFLFDGVQSLAALLIDRERAQQLPRVTHGDDCVALHIGQGAVSHDERHKGLSRFR